jgi:predicted branched-subunit amino acid permease
LTRRPTDPVATAIRQAVSVSVATGLYGVSFGALAVAAGLSVWQTQLLSMVMFTGGSQFALVGVLGAGGLGSAAVASAALLGARNLLYAVQLGPILGLRGWRRLVAAQLTIDESAAVALAQPPGRAQRVGFWWTGGGVWICWNALTLLGAWAGEAMGDPRVWGLDAAAAAAFLGLLWPRLAARPARAAAALAGAIALAATPWLTPGAPVLLASSAALVVGLVPGGDRPRPSEGPPNASQTSATSSPNGQGGGSDTPGNRGQGAGGDMAGRDRADSGSAGPTVAVGVAVGLAVTATGVMAGAATLGLSGSGVWACVLTGCAACLGLKLIGAHIPRRWLEGDAVSRVLSLVTVALLAGLLAVQTLGQGQGLAMDARLAALAVAGVALRLRAPFILVVIFAAATAAGLRALGCA